jgi:hypothetical protein
MSWILPSIFETLDRSLVIILAHGHNQMIVSDFTSVSENNGILIRQDLLASDIFAMGCEHVERELRVEQIVGLLTLLLLVDLANRVHLVDILV